MRNIIKCFFLTILMGAIWVACNNSTTAVGELNQETGWQRQGFETNEVTCLLNAGNVLIIGTQNGLFQMRGNRFISFGLENYVIKGIVRLRNGDFLAGAIKKTVILEEM